IPCSPSIAKCARTAHRAFAGLFATPKGSHRCSGPAGAGGGSPAFLKSVLENGVGRLVDQQRLILFRRANRSRRPLFASVTDQSDVTEPVAPRSLMRLSVSARALEGFVEQSPIYLTQGEGPAQWLSALLKSIGSSTGAVLMSHADHL